MFSWILGIVGLGKRVYGPGLKRLLLLGFTGLGFGVLSVWSGHRGCMRASREPGGLRV